jgi:hypothetical protein
MVVFISAVYIPDPHLNTLIKSTDPGEIGYKGIAHLRLESK